MESDRVPRVTVSKRCCRTGRNGPGYLHVGKRWVASEIGADQLVYRGMDRDPSHESVKIRLWKVII